MGTNHTLDFESCKQKMGEITRFQEFLKVSGKTISDIAALSECAERTIHNHIWTNHPLNGKVLRALHDKLGVSVDWLLSNSAPMWVNAPRNQGREEPPAGYASVSPREARLQAFITEWFRTRPEDDQAWLEVQIRRAIPEYEAFLSNHRF
jgi:hypothetical protein